MHFLQGHHPTIIDGYWTWEIGNVPSGPTSLDIRLDMLLFSPSSDDLPQDQPTEIQIDQYLRDKTSPSYKHLRARYWQLILPLVRAKYESTRKRYTPIPFVV
ncbi:hypothetical protein NCU08530 [Neurospora crassa OR74A]|uniref:Uncharacterized protein n=1 Tax=Neurospora crassa (strain ATCC 24698 / 74-OR23-1A / CBS 708.71 / DSM 1257 / FGSC 987) TaxID=367110 RepID=Q7SBM0_NEUCR|nr:hypothetical protein NCU08530 [Neurospora crassa OR74A]EAA33776.2 hypothetical protein NCU08530 [Neurospora crassa OR74A]|eukprot:XP_963012.2 hypothetical protein NCU08530 [Neurospora crassa OR74A]